VSNATETHQLDLTLLGQFSLRLDGQNVGGINARQQSLLGFLALERGTPHARAHLAFALWPDSTDSQARTNLRKELYRLRRALPELENYFDATATTLQWRTDAPLVLDVTAFETAIAAADEASQAEDWQQTVERAQQALALYRGDLLPGCEDEWVLPIRDRLHQQFLYSKDQVVRALEACGRAAEALRHARDLVAWDPTSETGWGALVRMLARQGDRAGAMRAYYECMQVLRDELGVDPQPELQQLYTQLLEAGTEVTAPGLGTAIRTASADWGDAPVGQEFYGRETELAQLVQWVESERCRLVWLLGLGGAGKTALSVQFARDRIGFATTVWRSLRDVPEATELIADLVASFSGGSVTGSKPSDLLRCLREQRCLLVLDNFESVLAAGETGRYAEGCELYGELVRALAGMPHDSCCLVASRERPPELSALDSAQMHVLQLGGCPEAAAVAIAQKGLQGTPEQHQHLCKQYGNNPLALKIVATSIQDLFGGDVAAFLDQDATVFNDIYRLLDQQCQRCTPLEKAIAFWLAVNGEPTSIGTLAANLVPSPSRAQLLAALESLSWRSLIERRSQGYTQLPVVTEYARERLVEATVAAIAEGDVAQLNGVPLLQAGAKDYLREMQKRCLVAPAAARLAMHAGTREAAIACLFELLATLRVELPRQPGYAAANAIALLLEFGADLDGCDLSELTLWEADLRDATLQQASCAGADLARSTWLDEFSLPLSLAFSPDSRLLAMGNARGEVRVWRVSDGTHLLTCQGDAGWVWSVAFAPDGETFAASSDRGVSLWDVDTGQQIGILATLAPVWSVAFAPEASGVLASGHEDGTVALWEIATQDCRLLHGHEGWIRTVAFAPDGQLLASGSDDGTIRLWECGSGECLRTLSSTRERIWRVAFGRDGILASSSDRVELWHWQTGELVRTLHGHDNWVRGLAMAPDGRQLASGSEDWTVQVWEVASGQRRRVLHAHANWVRAVAFSPDGAWLASAGGDRAVALWNRETERYSRTFRGYGNRIVAVAARDRTLVSGSDDGIVRVWDPTTRTCQELHGRGQSVSAVALTAGWIASGSRDGRLQLWEERAGTFAIAIDVAAHASRIWSVAFSPDGRQVATGSEDGTVQLWDAASGRHLGTLCTHSNWVCDVAFSPDGRYLASGSYDETICLCDLATQTRQQVLRGHENWVWGIAFSPDSRYLASGSGDHTVNVWEVAAGTCLRTLRGHDSRVWSVAFAPGTSDALYLASSSTDATVKVWNALSGECLQTLRGHTDLVWAIAFASADCLASGSQDETVKLWDWRAGRCTATLRAPRPYEGLQLAGATGLTAARREALHALGAVETPSPALDRSTPTVPAAIGDPALTSAGTAPASNPERVASAPSVLVPPGRAREWSAMQTWYDCAEEQLLLLSGEAGIGKTYLLEQLAAAATARGDRVLWGRGFESELLRPFGAWLDAVRTAEELVLSPELSALGTGASGAPSNRAELLDAATTFLAQLAEQRPVLLVFDDVQWLDEASLALLHYATRSFARTRTLRVACAVCNQYARNAALHKLLQALKHDQRLTSIALTPLDCEQTLALARAVAPDIDDSIYRDSGGNPLFARELARCRHCERADSLEALIDERLQHLDPAAREVMLWAALLGRSFSAAILEQVVRLSTADLLDAIADLETQGILRPSGAEHYEFAHDIVRQVARDRLPAPRRRLMHLHVARSLANAARADYARDIAYHARLGGENHLAASAALQAAERCLRLFAYTEAAKLAERGLEHCQHLDRELQLPLHAKLLAARAAAGACPDRAAAMTAELQTLIAAAKTANLPDAEAIARQTLIVLHYESGNLDKVREASLEASSRRQIAASPAATARMLAQSGWCLADLGRDMQRAEALLLEAQSLAERVGLELGDVYAGLGAIRRFWGNYAGAQADLERAVQLARAQPDRWRECFCLKYAICLELELGSPADALAICDAMAVAATDLHDDGNEALFASALAALARYTEDRRRTAPALDRAIAQLRAVDTQQMLAYVLSFAAELDFEAGNAALAAVRAEAALAAAELVGDTCAIAVARSVLWRGDLALGDTERVARALEEWRARGDEQLMSARARGALERLAGDLDLFTSDPGGFS